ncbi:response regulator [Rubripirellula sp.]|jgi:CheY-like chemotaxis protein|nr:response regulator [Rubripirellula sp.]
MNPHNSKRQPKVLVIDDDQDISFGTCCRLKHAGYETITAGDGMEGVEQAMKQLPDAILLDIRMPRMDGFTALKLLKESERTKNIPVVILSASIIEQQKALDSGAHFFLPKPCGTKQIVDAVHAVVFGTPA